MSEYDGYEDNNNILVNTITFTKNLNDELSNNNYKEEFKTCTNEFIAKEIMKNNIIHYSYKIHYNTPFNKNITLIFF